MTKKLHLILASLLLLMVGCQKVQSELDFDSLTMTAVITGYIEYDAGVNAASTNYTEPLILPAAEKTIFAEVEYREYTGNSDSKKIYEAVTDADGMYTFNIPTTSKGIKANIRMQDFTAAKSVYEGVKDNAPVFRKDSVVYSFKKDIANLTSGSYSFTEERDVKCTEKVFASGDVSTTSITLNGVISLAVENGFRKGSYTPASGADVKFDIKVNYSESNPEYNPGGANNFKKFTTNVKCDDAGSYSVTVPIESYEDGLTISSLIIGEGSTYNHYYAADKSMEVTGAYVSDNILNNKNITSIIDEMNYKLPNLYLKFTPNYNNELTTANPKPSTWTENLAGWECYNGFTEYATISGEYLMPVETAFATGAYANPSQEACVRIMYPSASGRISKEVYVNTDADGKYSFNVPVSDAAEKLSIVAVTNPSNQELIHYSSASETEVVEGSYAATNTVDTSDEWNEIGKQYFQFSPYPFSTPSTWNANLAGWQEGSAKFDGTATVSAKVYMAKEKEFAVGEYVAAADGTIVSFTVSQYVGSDMTSTTYNAVVSGGAISTEVSTIGSADPIVTITKVGNTTVTDFVHFKETGGSTKLTGTYDTTAPKVRPAAVKDRTAWNELGEIYLPFNPVAATKPTDFKDNLAGWVVADKPIESAVTFTAEILKAVENSYLVGSFNPATEAKVASIYITPKGASTTEYIVPVVNGKISAAITYDKGNTSENPDVVLSINNIEVEDFTHFLSDGSKIATKGDYSFNAYSADWTGRDQDERESFNKLGTAYLKFTPTSAPTDFYSNLAGWQIAENPIESAVTFTAEVVKAVENSYLMGSFIPASDAKIAAIYITPQGTSNTTEYIVPVVNGKISAAITYDKGDSNDDPTVLLNIGYIEVKDFTHYAADGSKVITGGHYIFNNYSSAHWTGMNKDDRESFNKLGVAHMMFAPTTAPVGYTTNLIGWKLTDAKLIETPVTFTANVFEAVESKYANGEFAPATHNMMARITIIPGGSSTPESYDVPVIDGKISAPIAYDLGDGSEPTVSLYIYENEVADFKHYSADGSSQKIKGKYYFYSSDSYWTGSVQADRESFNNLGDCFMQFNKTTSYIKDFYPALAGWMRIGNNDTRLSKTVTGTLMKTVETAYLTGNYTPAANELITVKYGPYSYIGATDDKGNYSIEINYITEPTAPSDITIIPKFISGSPYTKYDANGKKSVEKSMTFAQVCSTLDNMNVNSYTWNSRGTVYYRATNPTSPYILGWQNTTVPIVNKFTKTITVKFAAKQQAAKNDDATKTVSGVWNSCTTSMPAKITIDGNSYIAPTAGAERQMIIFVKDDYAKEGATISVAVELDDTTIKNTLATFTHYRYDTTDPVNPVLKTEIVYGKYSSGATVVNPATPVTGGVATVSDKDATSNFNPVVFTLADPSPAARPTDWNYTW